MARGRPFQVGHPGGPGRPKGSRHRLSEAFVAALADDFEQHGVAVIKAVRKAEPSDYLKIIASLMPKEFDATFKIEDTRTYGEILAATRQRGARLGVSVPDHLQLVQPPARVIEADDSDDQAA